MKKWKSNMMWAFVVTLIAIGLGAFLSFMIEEGENTKTNDMIENDLQAYFNLNESLPVYEMKDALIQLDMLYGDEVPSNVKEKIRKGYSFYITRNNSLIEEGFVVNDKRLRVIQEKTILIEEVKRVGNQISWKYDESSAKMFEWTDDKWNYIAKVEGNKYRYAKEDKEYGVGYNDGPILLLKEQ